MSADCRRSLWEELSRSPNELEETERERESEREGTTSTIPPLYLFTLLVLFHQQVVELSEVRPSSEQRPLKIKLTRLTEVVIIRQRTAAS